MQERAFIIGVCDDDELYRKRITNAVRLLCFKFQILAELRTYHSGEELLEEKENLDILFLDEQLSDDKTRFLNGADVRHNFEKESRKTLIICVTSHDEYMQDAFGMYVVGFVIKYKRDEQKRLAEAFQRCMEKLSSEVQLAYIEVQGHYTHYINTDGSEYKLRCSIDTIEMQCKEKKNLVRCHRSYIINLYYVEKVVGNFDKFILKNGLEVSISRSKKEKIKDVYLEFKERLMMDLFGDE